MLALLLAVGLSRVYFRSHYLYDIDSVNFALSLSRFDPVSHQPHPPGYFLYTLLGRFSQMFFHEPNQAFVAISVAASCGTAVMIYVLTEEWFGREAARFAGLIFLLSPLGWFHGTVALTYIVEAFFSVVIGYLCWRIYLGAAHWIPPAACLLGLSAGFRPSSMLFLGPMFLFSCFRAPVRELALGAGVLIATLLLWIVPMMFESGGWVAYTS